MMWTPGRQEYCGHQDDVLMCRLWTERKQPQVLGHGDTTVSPVHPWGGHTGKWWHPALAKYLVTNPHIKQLVDLKELPAPHI